MEAKLAKRGAKNSFKNGNSAFWLHAKEVICFQAPLDAFYVGKVIKP